MKKSAEKPQPDANVAPGASQCSFIWFITKPDCKRIVWKVIYKIKKKKWFWYRQKSGYTLNKIENMQYAAQVQDEMEGVF